MRFFKNIKLVSLFVLILFVGQGNVIAGPQNWADAEKYIPIQQKQFCDLKNRFLSNLVRVASHSIPPNSVSM